jgi:hypothetical protein
MVVRSTAEPPVPELPRLLFWLEIAPRVSQGAVAGSLPSHAQ